VFVPEIIFIAIGLSMDTFAVSLAVGMLHKSMRKRIFFRAILFFAVFQSAFAGIGWFVGQSLSEVIGIFDHWVAFILLLGIGGKMIWNSFRPATTSRAFDISDIWILIALSVATSIDALVAGMSIGFLDIPPIVSLTVIGLITALLSLTGFLLGIRNGFRLLGNKAEIAGGLILIGIGIKILFQHL
jgi:manganese efflux pump family protein